MHVDLLNDQSAEIRDAESFTRREREQLNDAIRDCIVEPDVPEGEAPRDLTTEEERAIRRSINLAILNALLVSWTLPLPLPKDDEASYDKLGALDWDRLDDATGDVMKVLNPQRNFELSTDPASPTKPSSD